jgi:hypothetical protein
LNISSVIGFFSSENGTQFNLPEITEILTKNEVRRFSTTVKYALYCGLKCLQSVEIGCPDAIITGSGKGSVRNIELFLDDIDKYNESALNPSLFIQSTHNTINGLISIKTDCNGYSATHVNFNYTVINVLDDAFQQSLDGVTNNVLVGFFDEKTDFDDVIYDIGGFRESSGSDNINPINWGSGICFLLLNFDREAGIKIQCWNSFSFDQYSEIVSYIKKNIDNHSQLEFLIGSNNAYEFESIYQPILSAFHIDNPILFKEGLDELPVSSAIGIHEAYIRLSGRENGTCVIINHILDKSLDVIVITK